MTKCKNKNCKLKKLQYYILNHQQQNAVYLAVFILFFIGSIRFNPIAAFFISLLDVLFIACFVDVFKRIFDKNGFKFKTTTYLWIIFLLFIFAHILTVIEFAFWKYLFYKDIMKWYPSIKRLLPHLMFKDTFVVLGSFIASLINYSNKQRKEAELLSYEKQLMELRFLKSQIKPHFVFNVLNNIYTLAYTKSDQAPEAILKLAEMLRYVTDECQSDTISIEKELKYIDNYVDLILMKTGTRDGITFEYDIDDYSVRIPPMLLQPAIENSFKHSNFDTSKDAVICFKLKIKNKILTFTAYNTKKQDAVFPVSERKGVGLSNIEQRLELYFQKEYILQIEDTGNAYTLTMEIDLTKMNII
jgi:sensor histidine kinase YesM